MPRDFVDFQPLERSIDGTLMTRGTEHFISRRDSLVWNACKPLRCPDAIVTVASVQDVRKAVQFARERGLKIAVRSTGHNYFGAHVREGGLLLDLAYLDNFTINVADCSARVQPAVKSGRFLAALVGSKLAFPVGHVADVGLGGYLLSGGMGWNTGQWGPACSSVAGIDVVLPNGELIHADEQHHEDLFWAARGAGPGFFGVITSYDVRLQTLPSVITVESVAFDVSSLDVVAPWLNTIVTTAPAKVELAITLGKPRDVFPCVSSNALSVMAVAFADSNDVRNWMSQFDELPAAARVLGRKRDAKIQFDTLLQQTDNGDFRPRMNGDVFWSNSTPAELLLALRTVTAVLPSEHSYVLIQPMRRLHSDSAFSLWGEQFVAAYGFWQDAADDARGYDWVSRIRNALNPLSHGHYVGEADLAVERGRVRRCFSASAWDKLTALKQRYDPQNTFFWYLDA